MFSYRTHSFFKARINVQQCHLEITRQYYSGACSYILSVVKSSRNWSHIIIQSAHE